MSFSNVPMKTRERLDASGMMLESARNPCLDRNGLNGIPQQVSRDTNAQGIGQIDQYDKIRSVRCQSRVDLMPDPLPDVDDTARHDLVPIRPKAQAMMAQIFRCELPSIASRLVLYP